MKFSLCLAWYRDKVRPDVTVILKNPSDRWKNGQKIQGRLDGFSDERIIVVTADTEKRVEIPVDEIKTLDLIWHGTSDCRMGELDGTALEGQHLAAVTYHHKVRRHPKLGWEVEGECG